MYEKKFNEFLEKNELKSTELKNGYLLSAFNSIENLDIAHNYFWEKNNGVKGSQDFTIEQFNDSNYRETQLDIIMEHAKIDVNDIKSGMKILGAHPYWLIFKS